MFEKCHLNNFILPFLVRPNKSYTVELCSCDCHLSRPTFLSMIVCSYLEPLKCYKALKLTILKNSQKYNIFDLTEDAPAGNCPTPYIIGKLPMCLPWVLIETRQTIFRDNCGQTGEMGFRETKKLSIAAPFLALHSGACGVCKTHKTYGNVCMTAVQNLMQIDRSIYQKNP